MINDLDVGASGLWPEYCGWGSLQVLQAWCTGSLPPLEETSYWALQGFRKGAIPCVPVRGLWLHPFRGFRVWVGFGAEGRMPAVQ